MREAVLWKPDGLAEYDIRRPLTSTGANLLGLVKHMSIWESRYFGEVFDRPFPEPLPRWDNAGEHGADMWATEQETRNEIIGSTGDGPVSAPPFSRGCGSRPRRRVASRARRPRSIPRATGCAAGANEMTVSSTPDKRGAARPRRSAEGPGPQPGPPARQVAGLHRPLWMGRYEQPSINVLPRSVT